MENLETEYCNGSKPSICSIMKELELVILTAIENSKCVIFFKGKVHISFTAVRRNFYYRTCSSG